MLQLEEVGARTDLPRPRRCRLRGGKLECLRPEIQRQMQNRSGVEAVR